MTTSERAARPPLEGVREAPFALRAGDDNEPGDGYTLDGYGAVFNREAVIDSYEGRFREKIAPGSMRRSFRESPPRIQFDHGHHPLIGSLPIADLRSISEDTDPVLAPEGGAHVIARLFDNWLIEPLRDAIRAQAVNGMSFRFSVVREGWETADGKPIRDENQLMETLLQAAYGDVPDEQLPLRTLKEVKVPEIGPVTWPAYEMTSVSVRSRVIDLGRLNDPEQRRLLATAVFIADTAENDAQRDAGEKPAVERPPETDAQPNTDRHLSVVKHPSPPDAQRGTPECVAERPSTPRPLSPKELRLRNQRNQLLKPVIGERSR